MNKKGLNIKKRFVLIFLAAGISLVSHGQISKVKFGKGFYLMAKDSSMDVKFTFRFQTLFEATQTIDTSGALADDFESEIVIRRARLKFDGFVYHPNITYKVELGLSSGDIGWKKVDGNEQNFNAASQIIYDAVLKWKFSKHAALWVGQTKLPGNRERVISSQQLQLVDRSMLNSKLNLDRDIGLQLHHSFKIGKMTFRDVLALSQGEGRNFTRGNDDGFGYTARLEWLPMGDFTDRGDYMGSDLKREPKPRLSLACTYDFNDEARRTAGQLGSYISVDSLVRDLKSVQADFMFKFKGICVMGEYARRTTNKGDVSSYTIGEAFNIQGGYLFSKNFEIAGRFTQYKPYGYNSSLKAYYIGNKTAMYTLCFSRYIVEHNLKFQTDISTSVNDNDDNKYLMFRFQVEVQL